MSSDGDERLWRTLGLPNDLRGWQPSVSIRPGSTHAAEDASLPAIDIGDGDHDIVVLETLGEGGMGLVSRARQRSLAREVALKRLRPGAPREAIARLLAEARIAGALEHPNIVPVHALGVDRDGRPVLVMKRVEGVTWKTMIERSAPPGRDGSSLERFHIETLIAVCHAVELAHSRGIIHRDLKPDNVMIGDFGEVYVLDWGLAVLLPHEASTGLAGTPAYMAPEMVELGPITPRTDVYLLGATLYEAITGRPLHAGESLLEVVRSILVDEPPAVGDRVAEELASICRRATARAPDARYATVRELRLALADYLTQKSSVDLTRESSSRLAKVVVLARDTSEPGRAELRRAFAECRFGLKQALRIWPDNARARAALDDAVRAMVGVELDLGNTDAVAALLDELSVPDAELSERLAGLKARDRDDAARVAALERLAKEHDLGLPSRARIIGVVVFSLGAIANGVFAFVWELRLDHPSLLAQQVVITVLGSLVTAIGLRGRYGAAGRQLYALVALGVGGMVATTLVSWQLGMPIPHVLILEMLGLTLITAAGAITLDRRLVVATAVLVAGVAALLLVPSVAPFASSVTLLLAWALFPPRRTRDRAS